MLAVRIAFFDAKAYDIPAFERFAASNDITFKYVHDLIMDHKPSRIQFIELPDIENVENVFIIAHLLDLCNYKVDYITYRTELPTSELTMETFLTILIAFYFFSLK